MTPSTRRDGSPASPFDSRLLRRGAPGYEDARTDRIFNANIPHRMPAAVLRAESVADVVAGVQLARRENLNVVVRSGGHSWAVWSLRDQTLLIDLGGLDELDYDPTTQTISVSPAMRGGQDLDPYLAARDRFFPIGHCDSVGLGGYLLQGGQGWHSRAYGWACENVIAVEVVTAAGNVVTADEHNHSDLFWAARGSGAAFPGIVTRFRLRTHPRPALALDLWTFRIEDLEAVLGWLHMALTELDVRVEPILMPAPAQTAPGGDVVDGERVLVLLASSAASNMDDALSLLGPLDTPPCALAHIREPSTIEEVTVAASAGYPDGHRWVADCTWTDAPSSEVSAAIGDLWAGLPTPQSTAVWYGWAPKRVLPDMAFSLQGNVYLAAYAGYSDAADDASHSEYIHSGMARAARLVGKGVYLGDTDFSRREDEYLSAEHAVRLQAVVDAWDPDGLFVGHHRA